MVVTTNKSMTMIRSARVTDAAAIASIYGPGIADRGETFDTTPKVDREIGDAVGCCGGPPKATADACCVKDEDAKAAGASGCGCSAPAATVAVAAPVASACCG